MGVDKSDDLVFWYMLPPKYSVSGEEARMNVASEEYIINVRALKRRGRRAVRSHYLIFLITCLFAAFVGSEFTDTLAFSEINTDALFSLLHLPSTVIEGAHQVFSLEGGVFAGLITGFSSGTIYDSVFSAILSVLGSQALASVIFILLSLFAALAFWALVANMFAVVSRRIFLEGHIYRKVPPQRYLFLFYVKKWTHVAWVMFVKFTYNFFWFCLFIVGGVIKHYSYFMVPYIMAENPSLSARQALTLSRRMMKGHKWECFLLDFSFLGWTLLRILTLGLSGLFYSNAYQISAYTEYYVELRQLAKQEGIEGAELLCDTYLYERASTETLTQKYADAAQILSSSPAKSTRRIGRFEAFLNFFGIALRRDKSDEQRELWEIKDSYARIFEHILRAEQYPNRLCFLPERTKHQKPESSNYMKKYTLPTLILMFFIFSFVGWVWEVALQFINTGVFVNRGTLHGPWLPIYGSGGALILTLLYAFRKNGLMQFFSAVVLCGIIEYFTAYALEVIHDGAKWWDYSGYFLNIHGRVCAEGLLVFGLGGIAVVYLLAPLLDGLISQINNRVLVITACVLLAVFLADVIYSSRHPNAGEGITNTNDTQAVSTLHAESTPAPPHIELYYTPF